MARAVNRNILEEMLEDFQDTVSAASHRMEAKMPSRLQLRAHGCRQSDWNDYMRGFKVIRKHARGCLVTEFPHYKNKVREHEERAKITFGVAV